MRMFTVKVPCTLVVEVEAKNGAEAIAAAEAFAVWLDPPVESIADYNEDHEVLENATLRVAGQASFEEQGDDLCPTCIDPRCDGCTPVDTASLDDSFHRNEMDVD